MLLFFALSTLELEYVCARFQSFYLYFSFTCDDSSFIDLCIWFQTGLYFAEVFVRKVELQHALLQYSDLTIVVPLLRSKIARRCPFVWEVFQVLEHRKASLCQRDSVLEEQIVLMCELELFTLFMKGQVHGIH